jgi:hypothetical protein
MLEMRDMRDLKSVLRGENWKGPADLIIWYTYTDAFDLRRWQKP